MVEPLPRAIFGKPAGASAYQIIEQHHAFEDGAVARAFRSICSGFEWRSTRSAIPHAPCYAALSAAGQILVAAYTDAGRDAAGRPHTLRVECVLTDAETFPEAWRQLADSPPPAWSDRLEIIGDRDTFWCNS